MRKTPWSALATQRLSAIDHDRLTTDLGRRRADEKTHHLRDILWRRQTTRRSRLDGLLQARFAIRKRIQSIGQDQSRADQIHRDTPWRQLRSIMPKERLQSTFARTNRS